MLKFSKKFSLGFGIGFSAGLLAHELLPFFKDVGKPLVKAFVKTSWKLVDKMNESFWSVKEGFEDILAEVQEEVQSDKVKSVKEELQEELEGTDIKKTEDLNSSPTQEQQSVQLH